MGSYEGVVVVGVAVEKSVGVTVGSLEGEAVGVAVEEIVGLTVGS